MCRNGDLSRENGGTTSNRKKDYFVLKRHEKCKIIYNVN